MEYQRDGIDIVLTLATCAALLECDYFNDIVWSTGTGFGACCLGPSFSFRGAQCGRLRTWLCRCNSVKRGACLGLRRRRDDLIDAAVPCCEIVVIVSYKTVY